MGCDDGNDGDGPPPPEDVDGGTPPCTDGALRCAGDVVEICVGGVWAPDANCAAGEQCQAGECVPGCVADCGDRNCGDDGCGSECGFCGPGGICDDGGHCADAPAVCGDDVCAPTEGCGDCPVDCGNCCGDGQCAADEDCVTCASDCGCAEGETCDADQAICEACVPQCTGRECGDDGCGGQCGACADGVACELGLCAVACAPRCDGRDCGPDGCGGACGACGNGDRCAEDGQCGPPPPTCGNGVCGPDEDCATCPQDCGACCGNGACANGESCASCAADCGCADGERCADDRNACVAECVPQCDGRNCGEDGCGGRCGECDAADACEAGVCVVICTPDCDGRVCGGDGCGGRCGECDADAQCMAGQCEPICQPNCAGRACGADGCGGVCGACDGNAACDAAGQCAPQGPIEAAGTYDRATLNGDDSVTIRVAETVVFSAIPGAEGECPFSATTELAQGNRLLGNAVSLLRAQECGRILTLLEPGEYTFRFYSDAAPVAQYALRVAMTPTSPALLPGSGTYGRPGAGAGQSDSVTARIEVPSIVRYRLQGGLGRCVEAAYSVRVQDEAGTVLFGYSNGDSRCNPRVTADAMPAGELILEFEDDGALSPYVLELDVEPIPNESTVLPRPEMLRDTDWDLVYIQVDEPSSVEFSLRGRDGQPCEAQISVRVRRGDSPPDETCTWSGLFEPGLHGYEIRAEVGTSLDYDRHVTVTPLNGDISGPGTYPRPSAVDTPEEIGLRLDAPQGVRLYARSDVGGCASVDQFNPTIVLADGRRLGMPEIQPVRCAVFAGILPAGEHRIERTGIAMNLVVEFADAFDGSQAIARDATGPVGEAMVLTGPQDTLLYVFPHEMGACIETAQRDTPGYTLIEPGQARQVTGCGVNGYFAIGHAIDGPVMLHAQMAHRRVDGLNQDMALPAQTYDVVWSPIVAPPVQSPRPARLGLDMLTIEPAAAGFLRLDQPECPEPPSVAPAATGEPDSTIGSQCGDFVFWADGPMSIYRVSPQVAADWSISAVETMAVPEVRPMPRSKVTGMHAVELTADRAGMLHVRFNTEGINCRNVVDTIQFVAQDNRWAAEGLDCETAIEVQAGDRVVAVITAERQRALSGSIETWID